MPAPTLFDDVVDNRGLFSDHYLTERFPNRDDVQDLEGEVGSALDEATDKYQKYAGEVHTWNESRTEDKFVQPILKDVLGWRREVQTRAQRQGRAGRPDYALFTTEERRKRAVREADGDETKVYNRADVVADAKYWGRPLDGKAPDPGREKRADMRQENPSFQIIDYVTLTGVDWGILTNGAQWRLYYEKAPSRLETYFEINLARICQLAGGTEEEQREARDGFRLFYALFRAEAHRPTTEGERFVDVVYEASDTYAEEVEEALEERIFDQVFLELATGLYEDHARKNGDAGPEEVLDEVYRGTLRLLYRLLFLLYAESRGLLPLGNPGYYDHSLTNLADRARTLVDSGRPISEKHTDFWNDLTALFDTIAEGDAVFDVPAYNGALFRRDNPANAFLESHEIGQKCVARALVNLTAADPEENPTGPSVDYTSLDVRQLGSVYEGLLEHRLVIGEEGHLDLRTDEGERKETGSYYTPHYVVEYIVEETLGPIVDERIEQFEAAMGEIEGLLGEDSNSDSEDAGPELDAARDRAVDALLTIRVCDPAMGSGHFLVYAADYLAERFAQVLGRYPDHNPVTERLEDIRQSILEELENQGVDTEGLAEDNQLRDTSLLKRLVMKRCIYGVDLNPMAVELAKLSLWLHSFTVGAPLSFLDHHLKAGNSLIGTSVDTVVEEIQTDLFGNVRDEILEGTKFLQDAAFNTDATLPEVEESAEAFRDYQGTMRPYKRLLDLWTAQYFGHEMGRTLVRDYAREVIEAYKDGDGAVLGEHADTVEAAEDLSDEKSVFHWELEFPEVFYELDPPGDRDNPGFDAVIGNPPYALLQGTDLQEPAREMYREIFSGSNDISNLFLKKAGDLIKNGGEFSFVVTRYWTEAHFTADLRSYLSDDLSPVEFVDFGNIQVWPDVNVLAIICRFRKTESETARVFVADEERYERADRYLEKISDGCESPVTVEGELFDRSPWYLRSMENADIWEGVREISIDLGTISRNTQGVKTGNNDVFVVSEEEVATHDLERERLLPMVEAREVRRFSLQPNQYVIYLDGEEDIESFPGLHSYLQRHRSELEERAEVDRGSYPWWRLQRPREREIILGGSRLLVPLYARENRFTFTQEDVVGMTDIYITKIEEDDYGEGYVTAVLDSALLNAYHATFSKMKRAGYLEYSGESLAQLPIREIDFSTPEDEREAHAASLTDAYETVLGEDTAPDENPVLDDVGDHLDANRADVVHDLLAHLAREMTDLKADRATYHLDVTDYVPAPSDDDGVTMREIGRYQPAPGATNSLLGDTTEVRESLRVGRLATDRGGDAVHVYATARFKPKGERETWPDAVPAGAEPDQWGYVETELLPVCSLHDCTELEAGIVVHWVDALNEADDGFSGYRDNATKTNSLLDRIYDAWFPDPSDEGIRDAVGPLLQNAAEAQALDRKIQFTDELIDQVIYRLYGLSDEEIELVED